MTTLRIFGTIAVVFSFLQTPSRADEPKQDEAMRLFEEGTAFFHDGAFDKAATAFRRAHALRPNWKLLYNIGQSEAAAKRYGPALEAFQKYLVLGGDEVPPDRRDAVIKEIDDMKAITGSVAVDGEAGLEIRVDDVPRGTTPLSGSVLVSAGIDHTFSAVRDGEVVATKTVRVNSGEQQQWQIALSTAGDVGPLKNTDTTAATAEPTDSTEEAPAAVEPKAAAEKSPLPTIGWALTGSGAAALIAAAVTGGLSLSKDSDLEPFCKESGCPPSKHDERETMEHLALATDVLIGTGAALAATGIALLIVSKVRNSKRTETAAALPVVGPDGAYLLLTKEF